MTTPGSTPTPTPTPASAPAPHPLRTTAFPDVRRPDAATALVSAWIVPDPGVLRPAAEAVLGEWERQPRPDAMLSLSVFLGADGRHLLNYAQWTDDDAHREWVRTRRPAAIGRVDDALPGIERPGPVRYRRHRSYVPRRPQQAPGDRPTLLVTPTFATTGPDAQRALADTVVDELVRAQVPGLLGAHVHLSQDGHRALNFAEWTGEEAWRTFATGEVAARLRAAIAALEGVTPAAPLGAAPQLPGGPGAAEAPDASGTPTPTHYRLYQSLVNIPASAPADTRDPISAEAPANALAPRATSSEGA
ncbi:antibiotic biosynthesis monooxygenase [Streptomyces sp. NPDC053427]|uniref:antibiotic biosynthesis monooxygenase n=1 Tax=Streptomyces sp. NPDC053427 TaxID=3365701 RepID=UPI0037D96E9D